MENIFEETVDETLAEYTQETPDVTRCRIDAIVGRIYLLAYDAKKNGKCPYETLETYVDSVIYSVLMWERSIKMDSTDEKITHIMPDSLEERRLTEILKTNIRRYYDALRVTVTDDEYLAIVRDSFGPRRKRKAPQGRKSHGIPIAKCDMNDNLIEVYPTLNMAVKSLGITSTHKIKKCLDGQLPSAYGFKWKIYISKDAQI